MRFSGKEDLDAPIDRVFATISDFAAYERLARARGARVSRTDRLTDPAPGMAWDVLFTLRNRERRANLKLVALNPPSSLRFAGQSTNYDLTISLGLVALSRTKTRLNVDLEVLPRTMSARLLLQSARLAKGRLTRSFQDRIHAGARYITSRTGQQG